MSLYTAFLIICAVESSNGTDMYNKEDPLCVGWTQMRPIAVAEVNRICALHKSERCYTLDDRLNRQKCLEMFFILVRYHLGIEASMDDIALFWCRGIKGMREPMIPEAQDYLDKVHKEMRKYDSNS